MIVYHKKIECSRKPIYVVPLSDIHYGTKNCQKDKLLDQVDWIKNKENCYWLDMGDSSECIVPSDPRFDSRNVDKELIEHLDNLAIHQANWVVKTLAPIKHKCIGKLEGNHEDEVRKRHYFNMQAEICNRLGVPDLGYECFIRLHLSRLGGSHNNITIYATHGFGSGKMPGSKVNTLYNLSKDFLADIYLVGHTHERLGMRRICLGPNREGRIEQYVRIYALTGTYYQSHLQNVESYSDKKGYSPTNIGSVKITIEPFPCGKSGAISKRPDLHISE